MTMVILYTEYALSSLYQRIKVELLIPLLISTDGKDVIYLRHVCEITCQTFVFVYLLNRCLVSIMFSYGKQIQSQATLWCTFLHSINISMYVV